MSYGEDGSLQVWRMDSQTRNLPQTSANVRSAVYHEASYTFHTGKNIWAVDVLDSLASNSMVASGGADGRIVYYTLKSQGGRLGLDRLFFSQSTIVDVRLNVQTKVRTPTTTPQGPPPHADPSKLGAKVIFDELKGDWVLVRALTSAIPAYPTGKFTGLATFQERSSTDPVYDLEYLYLEKGQFTTQQGITLSATRRYVYRYELGSKQISVWFVKPEDGLTVDYLFHTLEFPAVTPDAKCRTLKAHHLCNEDNYWAEYTFSRHASRLNSFNVNYVVKGPNKDYIADAIYTRQSEPSADAARVSSRNLECNGLLQGIDDDINAAGRFESPISSNDSFKSYAWVDESSFLVTTDQGWLLLGSVEVENSSEAGISKEIINLESDFARLCVQMFLYSQ
ncbi:succinate-semialdehyde dehydrogenas [NADP(+)] [Physcia stellaris]|nr:succinate-semialdehyde dehydrogenas [NADP(+)] [Physcia stellaris]